MEIDNLIARIESHAVEGTWLESAIRDAEEKLTKVRELCLVKCECPGEYGPYVAQGVVCAGCVVRKKILAILDGEGGGNEQA